MAVEIPRNLATLVACQFSKFRHLTLCNLKHRYRSKNNVSGFKIMINWGKMRKNRRKSSNSPNSAKIPLAQHCKWFHCIASIPKPYPRKKNFEFISHRKKVSWTISRAWRPSWILAKFLGKNANFWWHHSQLFSLYIQLTCLKLSCFFHKMTDGFTVQAH